MTEVATTMTGKSSIRFQEIGRDLALGAAGIAAWLLVWFVATSVGPFAGSAAFPTLPATMEAALNQLALAEFWSAVTATLQVAFVGLALALVVGIAVGIALASSHVVRALLAPTVEFLKPVPGIIILPLLLLIIGPSATMGILLVFIGCVWPILIQTYVGVLSADPVTRAAARSMLLSRGLTLRKVIIPSATPSIVTGIRIATAASLILAIGAGLIGGAPGLGQLLFVYQNNGDAATIFGLIILVGILGLIINVLLGILERRAVPWSSRAEVVA